MNNLLFDRCFWPLTKEEWDSGKENGDGCPFYHPKRMACESCRGRVRLFGIREDAEMLADNAPLSALHAHLLVSFYNALEEIIKQMAEGIKDLRFQPGVHYDPSMLQEIFYQRFELKGEYIVLHFIRADERLLNETLMVDVPLEYLFTDWRAKEQELLEHRERAARKKHERENHQKEEADWALFLKLKEKFKGRSQ